MIKKWLAKLPPFHVQYKKYLYDNGHLTTRTVRFTAFYRTVEFTYAGPTRDPNGG